MKARILMLAVVAGVSACGDDDGEPEREAAPMSPQAYEQGVEDAAAAFWSSRTDYPNAREGASNARNAKALARARERVSRFRERLAGLRPPQGLAVLHRQYLGALRVVLIEYRDILALARRGDFDALQGLVVQGGTLSTSSLRQLAAAERGLRRRGIAFPWTGRFDPWTLRRI